MAGSSKRPECVDQLMSNNDSDFLKAANVLVKIARNIQNNPQVEKFKSIQVGSRTFMENLLPVEGAVQCLCEMGFAESNDRFVYSVEGTNENLKSVKFHLEIAIKEKGKNLAINEEKLGSHESEKDVGSLSTEYSVTFQKLHSHFEDVLVYENEELQRKAYNVIPVETLSEKASLRLEKSPQYFGFNGRKPMEYNDCFLVELLHWFKYDFFRWMDSPSCQNCPDTKSVIIGMLTPTSEEMKWGASRVEGYKCNSCGATLRYPRYNHPGKLLETRAGRCGEWANCFTLLCRSLGYDARHILDWTDHVWTEVYSSAAGRWIHCDPCENVFDKPLMYEKGWGKKLSLIVGASRDEITDVTQRYTRNTMVEINKRRRNICRASWLQDTLQKMTASRQASVPSQRKEVLRARMFQELIEFASDGNETASSYDGRTTGSFEWRKARGELGKDASHTITPNPTELKAGIIHLQYFSSIDKYIRKSSKKKVVGWHTLTHSHSSIERKVEHDWKMVYLARTSSSERGHISWKFNFNGQKSASVASRISLLVRSTVFHSGVVKWLLCTEKSSRILKSDERHTFDDGVDGASTISLHAFLSGGDGENAWQHTQLFRESIDSGDREPQFEVIVTFRKPKS